MSNNSLCEVCEHKCENYEYNDQVCCNCSGAYLGDENEMCTDCIQNSYNEY